MAARFFDRQDTRNRLNGARLERSSDLSRVLDAVAGRPPFFGELIGDNGFSLLFGIGPLGCAQFSATDGSGVPEMAVARGGSPDVEFVEFLTGGTATPVPSRYCMPFARVAKIAGEFIDTGRRARGVSWEVL